MRSCNECRNKSHCAAVSRMTDIVMNTGRFEVFEARTKIINAIFGLFGEDCRMFEVKVTK